MAYQLAPITQLDSEMMEDYSSASLGDAAHTARDFSAAEGQAILEGHRSFRGRFGRPARRMAGERRIRSHMAGQPGHQWGWLIKMIGFENVRKLCAMPPAARCKLIQRLKDNAIQTFNTQLKHASAAAAAEAAREAPGAMDPALAPPPGSAQPTNAPMGAPAPWGDYGALMFTGEGPL